MSEIEDRVTHYVPWFAVEARVFRGRVPRQVQAVCGAPINPRTSTAAPTCAACRAYLDADPYQDKTGAEMFGADEVTS
jgi:hypothetical protein